MEKMDKMCAEEIKCESILTLDEIIVKLYFYYKSNHNCYIKYNDVKLYSCDAEQSTFVDDCYLKVCGLTKQQYKKFQAEERKLLKKGLEFHDYIDELCELEDKYKEVKKQNKETLENKEQCMED